MCGRYELHTHPAALALAFGLAHPPDIHPRYNIAPMQRVPVVRHAGDGHRELVQVRWGLVPRWAKDPSIGSRMINARAETIADKPSFRNAFRRHRCIVPTDGFYEWKTTTRGKQPIHIGMKEGGPFGMAGLCERWLAQDGEVLDTCTIVTTQANSLLSPLHDRMPVIVAPENYDRWLDASNTDVADLFTPFPGDAMTYYPVSTRVNAVRNDDPALLDRVAEAPEAPAPATATTAASEDPEQGNLL